MIIRKMQAEDLPQVAAIEQSLFGDPWSESAFRDTLNQKEANFIVAEDENGEMIGYCGTYRALDEAEIVNVAIRKEQQNHGYGTEMVQALIEEEKKKGAAFFFLEVRESNLSALAQFLLNLRKALSKVSFSLTITFDIAHTLPPSSCVLC